MTSDPVGGGGPRATDFQVSTVDGPAAGWHYCTMVEPDRVIWVFDFGRPHGWVRVVEGFPGAIAYSRAAYLPAGLDELDRGVIAYVRAEVLDSCPSTHGGSGWAAGSYLDGDAVVCGICGKRTWAAVYPVPDWVERAGARGREIHDAANVVFDAATAGTGTILAAALYDASHRCPWWARLPLIGRRHRCPVWAVDLRA